MIRDTSPHAVDGIDGVRLGPWPYAKLFVRRHIPFPAGISPDPAPHGLFFMSSFCLRSRHFVSSSPLAIKTRHASLATCRGAVDPTLQGWDGSVMANRGGLLVPRSHLGRNAVRTSVLVGRIAASRKAIIDEDHIRAHQRHAVPSSNKSSATHPHSINLNVISGPSGRSGLTTSGPLATTLVYGAASS